jgi:beta-galactosidase
MVYTIKMKLLSASLALACLAAQVVGRGHPHTTKHLTVSEHPNPVKRAIVQDIVSCCLIWMVDSA